MANSSLAVPSLPVRLKDTGGARARLPQRIRKPQILTQLWPTKKMTAGAERSKCMALRNRRAAKQNTGCPVKSELQINNR